MTPRLGDTMNNMPLNSRRRGGYVKTARSLAARVAVAFRLLPLQSRSRERARGGFIVVGCRLLDAGDVRAAADAHQEYRRREGRRPRLGLRPASRQVGGEAGAYAADS